jgi:hypothetical protein
MTALSELTTDEVLRLLAVEAGPDGYGGEETDEDDLEWQTEEYGAFWGWDALDYGIFAAYTYDHTVSPSRRIERRPTLGGFDAKIVEDVGGEGQGDTRYVVFSLSDGTNTRYFRKDGYYASYDGSTWDGEFREVTPIDRVVTFYE